VRVVAQEKLARKLEEAPSRSDRTVDPQR
jgi:hypothetical protein